MRANQFSLLTMRRFLPLFITQFMGAFNDNVFKNALVILITFRMTQYTQLNAQILVAMAGGVFIFPFFMFSAIAGQLADKYEKSNLIRIIKFAEIMLALLAGIGFYWHSVNLLMLTLFLLGTQATFFGPIKYAILPDHLRETELVAGNGLIEAGTFLAILLGTLLGGLLIVYPNGEQLISATVFFIAICGFVSSLYVPKTHIENPHLKLRYNVFTETMKLLRYANSHWEIFLSILGISWFWLVGAAFLQEFPALTKNELHADEHVVTYFIALFSIGIGLGSLLCNRLLKGKIHATYVPLAALGISVFTMDLYWAIAAIHIEHLQSFMSLSEFLLTFAGWRISLDLLLVSVCGGIYTVPLYAILQHSSEAGCRARVIASNNVMNALFMVLSALAIMLMLQCGLSVSQIFLMIALINLFVAIYICKLLPEALLKPFFYTLLKSIYRVKVVGLENYKNAGKRVVIVANHVSYLDPLLLGTFLPDKLTFAIDVYTAQKWWIQLFLRVVDTFPMHPTNPMAIKSLIELIKQDKHCVIFPEGRLTMTGALMKIYEGPGLIVDKAQAVLLPIRIQGAQYTPFSRLKGKLRIRFAPKITITIFPAEPLHLSPELKGRERRQAISNHLYNLMATVMFESSNYRQTLFQSLLDARATHGRHFKIIEDMERNPRSYQQIVMHSLILGRLIAKQTKAREYVGILLPNLTSLVVTFFAMQAYTRVPAMLNFSAGIKNVLSACRTAEIKTVYTSLKFIKVMKLIGMVQALQAAGITVIYLESLRTQITSWQKALNFIMAQCPRIAYHWINRKRLSKKDQESEQPAAILFTSGSEGAPKGVVLSHKNILANCSQVTASIDFNSNDKIFNVLPIFHSFGLTAGMMLPLFSGVPVFLYPSPLHYRIIPELCYDTNATILFGTDTFLSAYAKSAHPYDFYSIRYVVAGAEKLRHETLSAWLHKFGIRIFEGYGVTETAPVLSVNTAMHCKIGTVGRFLPGINYQIKPIAGIQEGGELWVAGPNVMKGYLLASAPGVLVGLQNDWHATGDIVTIDEEGYLSIKGRVKRFAKIAGEMVSLTMVEQQINKLWPGHAHAVVSIAHEKKGEQLVLVTTYAEANREALLQFARQEQINELAVPKKIMILKTLPLLGSGKIDYPEVYALVEKHERDL